MLQLLSASVRSTPMEPLMRRRSKGGLLPLAAQRRVVRLRGAVNAGAGVAGTSYGYMCLLYMS
eukprot:2394094-Pleurochrysis_carterae.AAC.7